MLLTCNPARTRAEAFDLEIDLATGPELLTGSTRLKAGTATKVALNIISTGAMVALGKVRGNLMIDLAISNTKLRDRAARLVAEIAKCGYGEASSVCSEVLGIFARRCEILETACPQAVERGLGDP